MPPRSARRFFAVALALLAALALAGAAAWTQRRALAHWWTLRELARIGVAPATVEVARFDAGRLELRALRAGVGDALVIDAIDADYTLLDLWRGRVAALRVSGVRLAGEIDEEGPRFGGLEGREAGEAREEGRAAGLRLPAIPINQLVIEDARAEIATAQGPLSVSLSVSAQEADGRVLAHGDLTAHHALADAAAKLELAGAGDAISGGAAVGLQIAPGADLGLPISAGSLALSARLEIAGSEVLVSLAPGPFSLTWGKGKQALRFAGTTPKAQLRTQLEGELELAPLLLEASGGDLRAPTLDLAARGFELDAKLELPWRLDGTVGIRELKDTRKPGRAPDFAIEGRVTPRKTALGFDLRATEAKGRAVLHAQGSFDPEKSRGDAKLRVEPIVFAKDGLQPEQLAPQLAGRLTEVTGSVEATGSARLADGRTRLVLDLAARDLAFATPLAQVEGVNGTLRVEGPSPYATPAGQLISIGRIGFGLDLSNGLVAGQLRPDGVVVIEKAEWQTLGGRVRTAGSVDPKATHQALVLEAEDLDLAQVLALVDLEGLSGEGRLDGRIPVDRSAEAIMIHEGEIHARPGGRLRYQPAPGVAGLKQTGQGFELLLGAFEDLQVETLAVELDGDANGRIKIVLHVVGVNPAFQDGRPLHYNLTVESRLADLLRKGAAVYQIPQEIEQRLERFGQRAR
ncbi:MAG TPA: YdbH domain-containing protein [Myxococcota bacterium]|jgi:hypothetical protein